MMSFLVEIKGPLMAGLKIFNQSLQQCTVLIFRHCKWYISQYGEKTSFPKLNGLSKPQDSCVYHQLAGAYNYKQEDLSRLRSTE